MNSQRNGKGISLILHRKQNSKSYSEFICESSPTSPKSITNFLSHNGPIVEYVRWQDVSETSAKATELFSRMHHEIILTILKELDFTDILAFYWLGFEKVLNRYNIEPELTEKFKSIDDDTLNLKRAYMTLVPGALVQEVVVAQTMPQGVGGYNIERGGDEYIDKAHKTPKLLSKFEKGKETVQN
ncbi:8470_t:CDS:2, partial [Racocetra fulgida]